MSVSDTEKSLRRRILFNSLDKGTPIEVVQSAIDLLENEFGAQPEIRYTQLIKRLRESFEHPAFRSGNLLGRIMMVRNKPADQIGPDPASSLPQTNHSGGSTANPASPSPQRRVILSGRDLVFNTLLGNISAAVVKRHPESAAAYREHFMKEALKMNLSRDCAAKLVSWAKSGAEMSSISGTDEELHKIINTSFVWLCGKFGPVFADKILLHAVALTEQLPEAFDHSPRKFL
ncbi:hypothetical protein [Mariniblastus fucicola]|uniref:Uncharacterized protein n=1 Tax=Mariniblastus fucicola TaxID=980251 RepID=A0A5B9P1V9_9BACT|nr:hypothetical protein [Mariniblastus fucicola]QEG20244.1 hypothetical protein MFFC18_00910 [Mariniblastus fucicola]